MTLSPSENHRYLMSQINPTLRFDGGDVKKWQLSGGTMSTFLSTRHDRRFEIYNESTKPAERRIVAILSSAL